MIRGFSICAGTMILAAGLLISAGCHKAASDDDTTDTGTSRPESTPATEFEQRLKEVRDGHFQRIWVFSRLDGQAFTSEDTKVLNTNAPKVVDWVGMDDKKKFIAGSNFDLDPPQRAALQKRYKIEDYSGK